MKKIRHSKLFNRYTFSLFFAFLLMIWGLGNAVAGQKVPKTTIVISPAKIRAAVNHYIIRQSPWNSKQLKVKRIKYNHSITVPVGKVSLEVSAPKHTDWLGAIPFTVNIKVNGRKITRLTVAANIEVWSNVVLTTKPLGRFQPIDADDIKVVKMDLARVPNNAVLIPEKVIGLRARRNIAANCILRKNQIEIPPMVKRGDIIQVVAESPTMKISVKGIAKQNGGEGDRIRVVNLKSKKIIYAKVVDGQTVTVEF